MAKKPEQLRLESVITRNMEDVMHQSIMPYAEHVILERALPRVEDGLKPVQRRILYTMLELGLSPDKPHRKSARIVGDCLGKYHPHGDSSVYDAMVRMAQPFNMEVALVDGHGNFGSVDGDSAAAMRYTEARMTPAAMQMLRDLEKDTVTYSFNFDDTLKEPDLLPGRFPNLLVNGATGIAVGLATNIPPHNPGEAIDAVIRVLEDPRVSLDELMKLLPAPDFPTGGYLIKSPELRAAYETGRGKLTVRAKTHFEEQKNGRTLIVVTEFPYAVNKANALQRILEVTQEKKALFAAVGDIRDESDRMGMRAVIEVKKDGDPERILQALFKYSDLQTTFGVNMVAIADGRPQQLGLKQIIAHYIRHQRNVVTRRTQYELDAAEKREHILKGLMIAVDALDEVIALIRRSKSPREAKSALMERFRLSDSQAQAILDLRLQKLTNLELKLIEKEYNAVCELIRKLRGILSSDAKLVALIRRELLEIRDTLACPRRTELISDNSTFTADDEKELAVAEEVTVALLEGLKVRRCPTRLFNAEQIEREHPLFILPTATDRQLRLFTDLGAALFINVSDIPETRPSAKPANLAGLLPFEKDERILRAEADGDDTGDYLFFTAGGSVKRTPKGEYRIRTKRTTAITLRDGDRVIGIEPADGSPILLISRLGMSIRFASDSVPSMGRVSGGVRCMKLDAGDSVLYAGTPADEGEVLVITDRGYGKRSLIFDYELQGRNGKGVKTFDFKKNGGNGTMLVSAMHVTVPYSIVVTQRHGQKTTLNTNSVRIEPRAGKGSMLVAVVLDDDVVAVDRA